MAIVNLTPHTINIIGADGAERAIPSAGLARVAVTSEQLPELFEGLVLRRQTMGEVTSLPAPTEGTIFLVSLPVLGALKGSRPDYWAPDTGPDALRVTEEGPRKGQIIAVRALTQTV